MQLSNILKFESEKSLDEYEIKKINPDIEHKVKIITTFNFFAYSLNFS